MMDSSDSVFVMKLYFLIKLTFDFDNYSVLETSRMVSWLCLHPVLVRVSAGIRRASCAPSVESYWWI